MDDINDGTIPGMNMVKIDRITPFPIIGFVMSECNIFKAGKVRVSRKIFRTFLRVHPDEMKLIVGQFAVLNGNNRNDTIFSDVMQQGGLDSIV